MFKETMDFPKPILIKLTTTQKSIVDIFCSEY